jgi:hypothetical protein
MTKCQDSIADTHKRGAARATRFGASEAFGRPAAYTGSIAHARPASETLPNRESARLPPQGTRPAFDAKAKATTSEEFAGAFNSSIPPSIGTSSPLAIAQLVKHKYATHSILLKCLVKAGHITSFMWCYLYCQFTAHGGSLKWVEKRFDAMSRLVAVFCDR